MSARRIIETGPDHWTPRRRTAGMRAKADAPLLIPAAPLIPRLVRWVEGKVRS